MREISRKFVSIPSFCNFVVLAKENAPKLDFVELKEEMIKLFEKYENKKHS